MKSYRPQGNRLLVLPSDKKHHETEGAIIAVDHQLSEATVVEVGVEVKDIYTKGDTIIIPQRAGVSQFHNGKTHLWINNSDVWAIVTEDK